MSAGSISFGAVVAVTLLVPLSGGLAGAASAPHLARFHPWVNLTNPSYPIPTARQAYGMAYDPDLGAALLFGGQDTYGNALGDTWLFVHGHWKNLSPATSPGARWQLGLVYDPALHGVLLFGGQNGFISICGASCALNDTWLYNASGWHQLAPAASPPPEGGGNLVYDTYDGYAFLKGSPAAASGYNVYWKFQNNSWTNLTAKVRNPLPTLGFFSADDPHDRLVLFYGGDGPTCTGKGLTWMYRNGTFRNLTATAGTAPTALAGSKAMTYDAAMYGVVLTGGYDASCAVVNQTWFFHNGIWHNVTKTTGFFPGRWDARLVYDPKISGDLTFSGNEQLIGGSNSFGDDTWRLPT